MYCRQLNPTVSSVSVLQITQLNPSVSSASVLQIAQLNPTVSSVSVLQITPENLVDGECKLIFLDQKQMKYSPWKLEKNKVTIVLYRIKIVFSSKLDFFVA